jgi:hypothetical protein
MTERKLFKITDSLKTIRYYILARDYGQAEEILLINDSLFMDYNIELLDQSTISWATENVMQNLYLITVEYLDQITRHPDTHKYLVSAQSVSIAITIVINNVGPSYQKIISIERQTASLLNGDLI